jgi:hypothetical protein
LTSGPIFGTEKLGGPLFKFKKIKRALKNPNY